MDEPVRVLILGGGFGGGAVAQELGKRLPGVTQHGLPIKTIGDALQIRNKALEMLEGAENTPDPEERRRMLTFVVAGGGYSGVEIAAELNDYVRQAERESYPEIQAGDV